MFAVSKADLLIQPPPTRSGNTVNDSLANEKIKISYAGPTLNPGEEDRCPAKFHQHKEAFRSYVDGSFRSSENLFHIQNSFYLWRD